MSAASNELQMRSIHTGAATICGMAPRRRIARIHYMECPNCLVKRRIIRTFSGSGWYEDHFQCTSCGEDLGTLYHPFERGWRVRAIKSAKESLRYVVAAEEFHRLTMASIKDEMGWE